MRSRRMSWTATSANGWNSATIASHVATCGSSQLGTASFDMSGRYVRLGYSVKQPLQIQLCERLEPRLEEAQLRGLVDHLQPADRRALVEHLGDRLRDHVHVRLRVDAPRDGEAHQLKVGVPVLTRLRVPAGAHDAALHGAHAAVEVELGGQRLRRVGVLVEVRQERLGVEEHAVAADRHDDRHAPGLQLLAEVLDLADARLDVVELHALAEADGDGLHIAAGHAAVGGQASKTSHSLSARKPPMLTSASFLALIVQPSVRSQMARTMSAMLMSAQPGSRSLMK